MLLPKTISLSEADIKRRFRMITAITGMLGMFFCATVAAVDLTPQMPVPSSTGTPLATGGSHEEGGQEEGGGDGNVVLDWLRDILVS